MSHHKELPKRRTREEIEGSVYPGQIEKGTRYKIGLGEYTILKALLDIRDLLEPEIHGVPASLHEEKECICTKESETKGHVEGCTRHCSCFESYTPPVVDEIITKCKELIK